MKLFWQSSLWLYEILLSHVFCRELETQPQRVPVFWISLSFFLSSKRTLTDSDPTQQYPIDHHGGIYKKFDQRSFEKDLSINPHLQTLLCYLRCTQILKNSPYETLNIVTTVSISLLLSPLLLFRRQLSRWTCYWSLTLPRVVGLLQTRRLPAKVVPFPR